MFVFLTFQIFGKNKFGWWHSLHRNSFGVCLAILILIKAQSISLAVC